jgi:tRNA threonylcarbamoyladenosine biosynthesis protein TsaE
MNVTTSSVEETRALGVALAAVLTPGVVVVLIGGLGVGKTALTQGIGAGLGVSDRVTSPTFTMVSSHAADGRRGISTLLHADLYRVSSGREADDLAIGELVEDAAVAVVEWGDVAPDVLGSNRLVITIAYGDGDDERTLHLDASASTLDEATLAAAIDGGRDR